jgi:hypothetical protein
LLRAERYGGTNPTPKRQAGFDAPTVAPGAAAASSGGALAAGYYVYRYVYSSTQYPNVKSDVSVANGQQWPCSNPSGPSAYLQISAGTGNYTSVVTVTKTTRSDVDKIIVYRTQVQTSSALAVATDAAGSLYYVATVDNDGVAGTATITDNGLIDTGEAIQLDNYVADTASYCLFDGTRWWCAGNSTLTATVTLNGTRNVTITDQQWFTGRDGMIATFYGVTSGGFDGNGSFYLKVTGRTTGSLWLDQAFTLPASMPSVGTSTITVKGRTSVLYRSKDYNPFAWGLTQTQVNADDSTTLVPQSFALELGGGNVTAMSIVGHGHYLVIHFDNPQRTIRLDLEQAESEDFGGTLIQLDNNGSVTAHFSQFHGMLEGRSVTLGMDTYNGTILACDGAGQQVVSDKFGNFLVGLDCTNDAPRFFHGAYDSATQLNCFWCRLYNTDERNNIMVWIHSSGECGWMPDFDVLCSAVLLDSTTNERLVIGGTQNGFFGNLLAPGVFNNWVYAPAFDYTNNGSGYTTQRQVMLNTTGIANGIQITTISANAGTFTVPALNLAAGMNVALVTTQTGGDFAFSVNRFVQSIVQTGASTWQVQLDGGYTNFGNVYASPHPKYIGYTWDVFTNVYVDFLSINSISDLWFAKMVFNSFLSGNTSLPIFDVTYTIRVGDSTMVTSGDLPWPNAENETVLYKGGIATCFRSFFDLGTPTTNKRSSELWATYDLHGDTTYAGTIRTNPGVRYYVQYAESSSLAFGLNQDTVPGGSTSALAFFNRTQVPSILLKEFGYELIEVGQNDLTIYNYTIKVQPAD